MSDTAEANESLKITEPHVDLGAMQDYLSSSPTVPMPLQGHPNVVGTVGSTGTDGATVTKSNAQMSVPHDSSSRFHISWSKDDIMLKNSEVSSSEDLTKNTIKTDLQDIRENVLHNEGPRNSLSILQFPNSNFEKQNASSPPHQILFPDYLVATSNDSCDVTNLLDGKMPPTLQIPLESVLLAAGSCNNTVLPAAANNLQSPNSDILSGDDNNDSFPGDTMSGFKRLSATINPRLRSRLQDPPPLLPAVQNQISDCSSILLPETTLLTPVKEGKHTKRVHISTSNPDPFPTQQTKRKSVFGNHTKRVHISTFNSFSNSTANNSVRSLEHQPSFAPTTSVKEDDELDDKTPSRKKKIQIPYKEIQWFCLILGVITLTCSIKVKSFKTGQAIGIDWWRWQLLMLTVISGRLVSGWIVKVLELVIERHYILKKRVLYFVYGLRWSMKNVVWTAMMIAVWESFFRDVHGHVFRVLSKILWCSFTTAISWTFKIFLVKLAANTFHRAAYFDRIQECVFHQYVLEVLSKPSGLNPTNKDGTVDNLQVAKKNRLCDCTFCLPSPDINRYPRLSRFTTAKFRSPLTVFTRQSTFTPRPTIAENLEHTTVEVGLEDGGVPTNASQIPICPEKLQKLTSATVSVSTLKKLMNLVRKTRIVTYSSKISHKESEISNEAQARAAAKQIFRNMVRPNQSVLTVKDFFRFLPKDLALKAFGLFETTGQGEISRTSLVNWVIAVFNDRKALSLTLNDNKTVVATLNKVLSSVVAILLFISYLLIFGVNTSKLILMFSSFFIPLVFIFGNTTKNAFEAIIFLFVIHPYDVGDRVIINGTSMVVEEINVLNTIFVGTAMEKIYYPNFVLSSQVIINYFRSADQIEELRFEIHMNTPAEKIELLKKRILKYTDASSIWYSDFRFVCDRIENCNRMNWTIWIKQRSNFQNIRERQFRRSDFLMHLKSQLEDVGIKYKLPAQDVFISNSNQEAF